MDYFKLLCLATCALGLLVQLVWAQGKGNELIIVGGKCGPRLVLKTNGKGSKRNNILLIGPECKEVKKEQEVKYIAVPVPMHMDMHGGGGGGGGMGGGWRRRR